MGFGTHQIKEEVIYNEQQDFLRAKLQEFTLQVSNLKENEEKVFRKNEDQACLI